MLSEHFKNRRQTSIDFISVHLSSFTKKTKFYYDYLSKEVDRPGQSLISNHNIAGYGRIKV